MGFNQGIFPTSVYGQLSDSYGLPDYTNSLNPFSNTVQTGLVLGQGWLLVDFTVVNLLECAGAIGANAACTFQAGNSNFYTVQSAQSTTNPGLIPVIAINDRGGALSVSGGVNWMTTKGLASANCAASLTASSSVSGAPLVASTTTSGQLVAAVAGTSYYNNILLLNNTTTAGAYPVFLQ